VERPVRNGRSFYLISIIDFEEGIRE